MLCVIFIWELNDVRWGRNPGLGFDNFYNILALSMGVGVCVCQDLSQFLPSTMWVPGMNSNHQALWQALLLIHFASPKLAG